MNFNLRSPNIWSLSCFISLLLEILLVSFCTALFCTVKNVSDFNRLDLAIVLLEMIPKMCHAKAKTLILINMKK
jgi:hypothetical protein